MTSTSRLFPGWYMWAMLGCYGLAKATENLDKVIMEATGGVSGPTMEHLLAALAIYSFVLAMHQRHPEKSA